MKQFKRLDEAKKTIELQTEETSSRYLRPLEYNAALIVEKFLIKLNNEFKVEIQTKNRHIYSLNMRTDEGIEWREHESFIYNEVGNYIEFKIDDYDYYLQLDDNPFFEDSSYITCNKIYTDQNGKRYYKNSYCGGFNIYKCFNNDIYDLRCDYDSNAENLLKWFKEHKFEKPNRIYIPHPRKAPGVCELIDFDKYY